MNRQYKSNRSKALNKQQELKVQTCDGETKTLILNGMTIVGGEYPSAQKFIEKSSGIKLKDGNLMKQLKRILPICRQKYDGDIEKLMEISFTSLVLMDIDFMKRNKGIIACFDNEDDMLIYVARGKKHFIYSRNLETYSLVKQEIKLIS